MRKNKMMRAASALMVAVLLTTCTISGTFAKYVTTAEGKDTARVAKWGVEVVGMADTLFAQEYDSGKVKVGTADVKDLVAPGTTNTTGVTFGIEGQPEVAVKVKFEVTKSDDKTKAPVEVYLPAGTYTDYTKTTGLESDGTAKYGNTFTVADPGYYPVVFTLKDNNGNEVKKGTLAEIKAYLEGAEVSKEYPANTDLSTTIGKYTLTWAWAFGSADFGTIADVDRADTYLGNVAAKTVTDEKAITNIDFAIAITVEQVD